MLSTFLWYSDKILCPGTFPHLIKTNNQLERCLISDRWREYYIRAVTQCLRGAQPTPGRTEKMPQITSRMKGGQGGGGEKMGQENRKILRDPEITKIMVYSVPGKQLA